MTTQTELGVSILVARQAAEMVGQWIRGVRVRMDRARARVRVRIGQAAG